MKDIIYIRNSVLETDVRLKRAIEPAIKIGSKCHYLGWERAGEKRSDLLKFAIGEVECSYFYEHADFGKGIRNILSLIKFNIWLIYKLISKRKEYGAIYSCDLDSLIPSLIVKYIFKKKVIYDIFDFYAHTHIKNKRLQIFLEQFEYFLARFPDELIVCTKKRHDLMKCKNGRMPHIILNTPKVDFVQSEDVNMKKESDVLDLVYVGTLPESGRLLKEVLHVCINRKDVVLHVAGNGPLVEIFTKASNEHENIIFHGYITTEESMVLQATADLLFATYDPSIKVNALSAPNKVYEAMYLGKPIIVCKGTDADEVVTENQYGFAIEYSKVAFENEIDKIIKNKCILNEYGVNAKKTLFKGYEWKVMEQRLLDLYASI